jgi:DNA-binding SARP family transcriptional activator
MVAGSDSEQPDGHGGAEVGVRLLGPVRLHKDGAEIGLGGPGPRTLLAVLATRSGTVVTMDELVDALWGDRPPKTAGGGVYTYVSQLRKKLTPDHERAARSGLLTSSRAGYCLHIPAEAVDLHRFEAEAARARKQWAGKQSARALEHCDAALADWSGPPLGGTSGPFADSERSRLDLARLDVQELRCAALLETGAAEVAAAELATLAERNPLRERLHELLMLALSRTGRQADALQTYRTVRERLVDELGIDPGPALRQMQQLVLNAADTVEPLLPPTPADSAASAAATTSAPAEPTQQRSSLIKPAQLPHRVARFVGRTEELRRLKEMCAAADADEQGRSVVISAIDGVGGVGKTALAIHAAHGLVDAFPDGQLFVDLRGFDPRLPPVTPGEALGHLLRGLGADIEHLHGGDIDAQAALYRSILAGRRVLVVLDNAVSAEQVRPLLPGSAGCLALVTSRNRLAALTARDGAVRLSLGVLRPDESLELLRRILGTEVVDDALDETRELAGLCGHLPLALRIAAERIASSEHDELADVVGQLRDERARLDALSLEDDESAAVRAVFSWSYQTLKPEHAHTFRLLGLHPGVQFGIEDAAALLGSTPAATRTQFDALLHRNLLEQTARDRYRFHDLIRLYAAECAAADENPDSIRAAVERLLHWYLASTLAVREVLAPALGAIVPAELAAVLPRPVQVRDYGEAISWAGRELVTLADLVRLAADQGFDSLAMQLACALGALYHGASRWNEWSGMIELGRSAAGRLGDELGQARLDNDRGVAYHFLGRHAEADDCHRSAVDILTRLDDPDIRPAVTVNLTVAYMMMGRHLDALPLLESALEIARAEGNVLVEAVVCDSLGAALSNLGRHEDAVDLGRQAVQLIRRTGVEHMLGHTLLQVGESCLRAGRPLEAADYLGDALDLWRKLGNIWGETNGMRALATAWRQAGDPQRARDLLLDALTLLRESAYLTAYEREAKEIRALLAELSD